MRSFILDRLLIGAVFTTILASGTVSHCLAQDTIAVQNEAEIAKRLYQYYAAQARDLNLTLADGSRLNLVPEPLITWSVANRWFGSFFVWKHQERPIVIGCILSSYEKNNLTRSLIEMHLLTEAELKPQSIEGNVGSRQSLFEWSPDSKRIAHFQIPLSDMAAPAARAVNRMIQMRAIARKFTARRTDANGDQELRLMPQPIHRSFSETRIDNDITVFSICAADGTDPEMLLIVESSLRDGVPTWFYRPIRFTTGALELKYNNEVVWSVTKYNEAERTNKLTDPYMIVTTKSLPSDQFNKIVESILAESK